ncbi:MAG: YchJ family protein [Candidatus Krumholzibacteria bacterium]|nr:YchJ family protein [Candidatus Krumholzibacteria bacterium]
MMCPCGSGAAYADCCQPIIAGAATAATCEALMRARYCAYTLVETDFLLASLHPEHRSEHDAEAVRTWAAESQWHGLEIIAATGGEPTDDVGQVEFACEYTRDDERYRHHEQAQFSRHEGNWYFVTGEIVKPRPYVREAPKQGRNDLCACGSGKKYKKCCGVV